MCGVTAGRYIDVCGTTCPSGYTKIGSDTWPSCSLITGGPTYRAQCQRLLDGDVLALPQYVAIPSGQSINVSVSWSTTHATSAELRVTPPGQAERVLSTSLSGSLSYGPVRAGESHTFRLFGNGELLDVDGVHAVALTGTISASPQTVVVAGSTGTTTIAWSTQNAGSSARVYVRVNGGAPSLFAAGASGTQAASWIAPGNSYRFSLHAGDSTTAELAAVVVTGQAAVVPTSGPWWNPARSGNALDLRPSGTNLSVTWLTYNLDGSPIWYTSWLGRTGAAYSGAVNRYTWNGSSATSSVVGTMTLTPATATTGSLAYTVDGRSATEPIEYFELAGAPIVPSLSGVWYPPAESGWGVYFDTQGSLHSTFVVVYDADGRPTWAYGVATGGATVVSFNLLRVTGTNLCPGCIGPTSASTATAGTLTVDTTQLGSSQLRVDLSWPVWPRTAVTLNRMF
jgi:serine protease